MCLVIQLLLVLVASQLEQQRIERTEAGAALVS